MAARVKWGEATKLLRELRGWNEQDLARTAGLAKADVEGLEAGIAGPRVLQCVLGAFGLDDEAFANQRVQVLADADVFLFSGAYSDIDFFDLAPLSRALLRARLWVVRSEVGRRGLSARNRFHPIPVDEETRVSPAYQGYRLARLVRDRLAVGAAPLLDLRALLEGRLGIVVSTTRLNSHTLRASSVLDAERAGAAVVLDSADEMRRRNPLLSRVYMAHELCHLLFDPSSPERIQVRLDDENCRGGQNGFEKRARAFAAELLLPTEGVYEVAEEQGWVPGGTEKDLVTLLRSVCSIYVTPREIAVRHLYNQKVIGWAEQTLLLNSIDDWEDEGGGQVVVEVSDVVTDDTSPCDAASAAWAASRDLACALAEEELNTAVVLVERITRWGQTESSRRAAVYSTTELDRLLSNGEVGVANGVLAQINTSRLPPRVLSGIAMITSGVAGLEHEHVQFMTRTCEALAGDHGWTPERVKALRERLE